MTDYQLRTVDEIVARFRVAGDPFGWERETIIRYLPWDAVKGITADTSDQWAEFSRPHTVEAVVDDAVAYAAYAWRKVLDHRPTEAQRAMFKLDYWCWLLGSDRLTFAPDDPERRGILCVTAIGESTSFLGVPCPPTTTRTLTTDPPVPVTHNELQRISRLRNGLPCVVLCPDGCLDDPAILKP